VSTEFKPHQLSVESFARAGARLSGSVLLSKLERVAQDIRRLEPDLAQQTVEWSAQGELREVLGGKDQIWLHLQARTSLPMTCQRCMEVVQVPLQVDRAFRFVADEATAEAQDDDTEEDLLALERQFDLLALLEDELLMAMPMVPMHEVCPRPVKLVVADADFDARTEEKPNPFAVLANLAKKNTPHGP
jgi:uncharacterized protein